MLLVCGAEILPSSMLRRRYGVHESMKKHPERLRQLQSGFNSKQRIDLGLSARVFGMKDKKAAMALHDPRKECKETSLIRIAWHVIHDSKGKGNVSDEKLKDQLEVLNSTLQLYVCALI